MRNIKSRGRLMAAGGLTILLGLTGCDYLDPLKRPYSWHPTEINRQNIAAMAARPDDLIKGRGTNRRRVVNEAAAVDKIWSKPIESGGGGGGGAPGGGAGGGGGASPPAGG